MIDEDGSSDFDLEHLPLSKRKFVKKGLAAGTVARKLIVE